MYSYPIAFNGLTPWSGAGYVRMEIGEAMAISRTESKGQGGTIKYLKGSNLTRRLLPLHLIH